MTIKECHLLVFQVDCFFKHEDLSAIKARLEEDVKRGLVVITPPVSLVYAGPGPTKMIVKEE